MTAARGKTALTGEHQDLLTAALRCKQALVHYPDDTTEHARARAMLTGSASACRSAARVLELDPTLASEPHATGRFRSIDLLAELVRQLVAFLRGSVLSDYGLDRWPRALRWEEAEALYERVLHFGHIIPTTVPRLDHDTVAGVQAISADRLAASHDNVAEAARLLDTAVTCALRLPHPDPRAVRLAETAKKLRAIAAELDEHHQHQTDVITEALGLARSTPADTDEAQSRSAR